jgi:hypothetical protein
MFLIHLQLFKRLIEKSSIGRSEVQARGLIQILAAVSSVSMSDFSFINNKHLSASSRQSEIFKRRTFIIGEIKQSE